MKAVIVALAAGVAYASPLPAPQAPPAPGNLKPTKDSTLATISSLSTGGLGSELDAGLRPLVRNELVDNTPCGQVSFIFARASSEPNNMGGSMGPWVCSGLKKALGGEASVNCQGVSKQGASGGYTAGLLDNANLRIGTTQAAVDEATKMFQRSISKCPNSIIVFGGYSQGTAVMHATVGKLPSNIKNKIAGGVLFGDTRNTQDRGQVPNFPKEKIRIYCVADDGVCGGLLAVTNGHFAYTANGDGDRATSFLVQQINAAGVTVGAASINTSAEALSSGSDMPAAPAAAPVAPAAPVDCGPFGGQEVWNGGSSGGGLFGGLFGGGSQPTTSAPSGCSGRLSYPSSSSSSSKSSGPFGGQEIWTGSSGGGGLFGRLFGGGRRK